MPGRLSRPGTRGNGIFETMLFDFNNDSVYEVTAIDMQENGVLDAPECQTRNVHAASD